MMAPEAVCEENQCFVLQHPQPTCFPALEIPAVVTFFTSSNTHGRLCPTADCPSSPLFSLCIHTLQASAKTSLPQEGLL